MTGSLCMRARGMARVLELRRAHSSTAQGWVLRCTHQHMAELARGARAARPWSKDAARALAQARDVAAVLALRAALPLAAAAAAALAAPVAATGAVAAAALCMLSPVHSQARAWGLGCQSAQHRNCAQSLFLCRCACPLLQPRCGHAAYPAGLGALQRHRALATVRLRAGQVPHFARTLRLNDGLAAALPGASACLSLPLLAAAALAVAALAPPPLTLAEVGRSAVPGPALAALAAAGAVAAGAAAAGAAWAAERRQGAQRRAPASAASASAGAAARPAAAAAARAPAGGVGRLAGGAGAGSSGESAAGSPGEPSQAAEAPGGDAPHAAEGGDSRGQGGPEGVERPNMSAAAGGSTASLFVDVDDEASAGGSGGSGGSGAGPTAAAAVRRACVPRLEGPACWMRAGARGAKLCGGPRQLGRLPGSRGMPSCPGACRRPSSACMPERSALRQPAIPCRLVLGP